MIYNRELTGFGIPIWLESKEEGERIPCDNINANFKYIKPSKSHLNAKRQGIEALNSNTLIESDSVPLERV